MWDDREGFPHFSTAIESLGSIDKFKHIIGCLKSPKIQTGLTWDTYLDECVQVGQREKIVYRKCAEDLNQKRMS